MKKFLLTGACIVLALISRAQINRNPLTQDTGILYTEKRIELSDARRIPTEPILETPEIKPQELTFSLSLKPATVPNKIEMPAAEKMQKEREKVYHQNYVKLGYGNNLSPLADVYFAMPGKEGMLAFNFHHLSANGPGYQDFSSNHGSITGKKYFKKGNLEATFLYKRNAFNFFGYDRDRIQPSAKDTLSQFHQTLGGTLGYESKALGRGKPYYRFDAAFFNFSDKWEQSENTVRLHGLYRFMVEKNEVNIDLAYQLQQFGSDSSKLTRHFIDIQPSYVIRKDKWELELGFVSTIVSQENNNIPFKFFPRVQGVYIIEKDQISVFGGIGGKVNKNTFREMAGINPFLTYDPNLTPSIDQFEFNAGLKGRLSGNTGFVARVLYTRTQDMPLFINDTNELRSFRIITDDVNLLRFNAEISHQYSEKFRLSVAFNYYNYTATVQQEAWQLPNLDLKVNATYNMADKILLSLDAFVIGKRMAYTAYSTGVTETLKPFADLNLGIDYRWKKQISAFVKLNNLLGQHYQLWYRYPAYSFNFHAGLAIGF